MHPTTGPGPAGAPPDPAAPPDPGRPPAPGGRVASGPPAAPGRRAAGVRRAGLPALAILVVAFLVVSVPRYLTGDPARSLIPVRPDWPPHYALLVGHIECGSVALLAGCLQLWPRLRARRPAVHRWVGRAYLFGGVFPAGIMVLGVSPVSSTGFASSAGNTVLALLWLGTSAAGYRAARARRWSAHRAWMLRSVALSLSIVVNRLWLLVLLPVAPTLAGVYGTTPEAMVTAAATASVWLSWTLTLLAVEWWALPRRPGHTGRRPDRAAGGDTPATAA